MVIIISYSSFSVGALTLALVLSIGSSKIELI